MDDATQKAIHDAIDHLLNSGVLADAIEKFLPDAIAKLQAGGALKTGNIILDGVINYALREIEDHPELLIGIVQRVFALFAANPALALQVKHATIDGLSSLPNA